MSRFEGFIALVFAGRKRGDQWVGIWWIVEMWRVRVRLKRPTPRSSVGIGPDRKILSTAVEHINQADEVSFQRLRLLAGGVGCANVHYYCVDAGREGNRPGSFSRMSGTMAPGKQCVTALAKRRFLTMESPIIRVVRGMSGATVDKPGMLTTASFIVETLSNLGRCSRVGWRRREVWVSHPAGPSGQWPPGMGQ